MNNSQGQVENKKNWQEKKLERELEAKMARRRRMGKKIAIWGLVLLAAAFLTRWHYSNFFPKGVNYSESIPILGRNHILDGTKIDVYNSNPPTSGPHYSQPANTGFYDTELPDERIVHNLEHGNIWIAYRPSLPKETVNILRGFAGGMVIVTPRAANDKDIALAAWGRLDKFNLDNGAFDPQRIKDFILRYQNQGPENVTGFSGHLQ